MLSLVDPGVRLRAIEDVRILVIHLAAIAKVQGHLHVRANLLVLRATLEVQTFDAINVGFDLVRSPASTSNTVLIPGL